uniref:Transmembrane protein n=1 Tax=Peronospora matthiolae TaxID=2874970 RepID=A0AAV1UJL9_9STRA
MVSSPTYARAKTSEESRDDLALVRHGSGKFSTPVQTAQRSFTTEDLPSVKSFVSMSDAMAETKKRSGSDIFESSRLAIMKGIQGVGLDRVVDKMQKAFTPDDSERVLRAEWLVVETEEQQLQQLQEVVHKLQKAFKFSNRLRTLVKLANTTLVKCDELVDRSQVHLEQCNLMFAQFANEIATLTDYLSKLREAVIPSLQTKDGNEEKKHARRAEWALVRMTQSSQTMVAEMQESLDELDELTTTCTELMVQSITLLHMRGRSADFSGTGVAAGAASVVAGAVVSVAGVVAAPATSGLSVPISLAGKSLFLSGIAALTPSSIMLNRQSQQLSGLSSLVVNLKSCLEIMNLKREEMSVAFAAVEGIDLDIKQAMAFCQDAVELEISIYESSWIFIEDISVKLLTLSQSVELFQASPSVWHFCKSEDAMYQYLLAEDEED